MKAFTSFIKIITLLIILFVFPVFSNAQTCTGTTSITSAAGTFSDGSGTANYDNNLNCSWLIQPSTSPRRIELNMTSMALSFFNDRVRVYDGINNTGTLLATYNGNNIGNTIVAYSGSMFIEFTTDDFGRGQGWDANFVSYVDYCQPNTVITANNGDFTDGSQNGTNYLDNTDCEWLIQTTTPNMLVRLTFSRFNTESGFDTLTIYDGISTSDPILGTYSGNTIPAAILSTGGDMLVSFKSDGSITANGWRALYQIVPAPTCGGTTTLTASSGIFDDGSGASSDYTDNLNCSWLIQPLGATIINLSFTQFDTETGFDFVTIYDGANNNAPVLGTYSGSTLPLALNSSGGSVFVEFNSDQAVNETGWEINYNSSSNQCFTNLQLTSLNGNINDGSNSNNYQNNLNCSWVIQPVL
ncbi:MAG: CUB domain-containing protein, partial [Flavobacteriales bacterium]|nr:CUB domain-containing protein [Flavobacteriales bacterium]